MIGWLFMEIFSFLRETSYSSSILYVQPFVKNLLLTTAYYYDVVLDS